MAGLGSKKFMGETKSGSSDIISWKDDGKIIGFIHQDGFFPRKTCWLSFMRENNEEEMELVRAPFVCPGLEDEKNRCPICELREFLKEHPDIEDDETIYEVGKKKKRVEIMKGDALGLKDFDWRLSLIPNKEFLFGFVDVDNTEGGVGIVIASAGLGRAISNCMESRMDDVGDEDGDPLKNPYAIKLVYKEKETPANKYKAYYNDVKLTDEVKALLKADAPSLNNLIVANTPREIWDIIENGLDVEGFEPSFLKHEDEEAKGEKKSKGKKKKVEKGKGSDGDDDEDAEETKKSSKKKKKLKTKKVKETDDEEKEEKSEKKKKLKLKVKKEKEEEDEDMEPCPACNKEIPLSSKKCEYCGVEFELNEDEELNDSNDDKDDDEEMKKCEFCGERVKSSLKRCPECGEKF